ncbi:MAG: alpha/beta hydrolase [Anaerolineae bacterium]|nr:alpha/beta hydrolase [Anaerolineae bacterium]
MSEPTRQTITVQGLATSYAVAGSPDGASDRLPIVALHGWGGSIESFWPVAEALAPLGYTVHVLDLPGFGQSALPPTSEDEAWSVPEYAAFVLAYLAAQGLDRVHLLGHSFGGRISLILGAEHADRLDKIVLAGSAGVRPPGNPLRDAAVKAGKRVMQLPGLRALYEPARRRLYEELGATDYLEAGPLQATFVKVVALDLLPVAARVSRPTLLIWGDRDEETPLWMGRQLERTIPDAGLVTFQGAGHFCYLERLADYVRIVNHFLSQSEGEAA